MRPQLPRLLSNQFFVLFIVALISIFAIFWPHAQPEPVAVEETSAPPPIPKPIPTKETQDNATTVLELFNPSDQSVTHQLTETALSQQVEQVMATSYILAHCGLMSTEEYRDNFRALIVFAQHNGLAPDPVTAEATVRRLAESAGVSYAWLYSRTNCTDPQLPGIERQMTNWRKIYLHE